MSWTFQELSSRADIEHSSDEPRTSTSKHLENRRLVKRKNRVKINEPIHQFSELSDGLSCESPEVISFSPLKKVAYNEAEEKYSDLETEAAQIDMETDYSEDDPLIRRTNVEAAPGPDTPLNIGSELRAALYSLPAVGLALMLTLLDAVSFIYSDVLWNHNFSCLGYHIARYLCSSGNLNVSCKVHFNLLKYHNIPIGFLHGRFSFQRSRWINDD
jgi:hypothetical protein